MKAPYKKTLHRFAKSSFLIGGIVLSSVAITNAQDIHFSQFDETPLLLNPANAGAHHDVCVILNYKNQWQTVGSPYKTFNFSGDVKLLKKKKQQIGLGLDFFSDKAGEANMGSTQIDLSLSAVININKKSLISAGLMAGYAQRGMSAASKLQWGNQYDGMAYDPTRSTGEINSPTNFSYTDFGGGIQWSYGTDEMYISANNTRKFNLGVSVFHPQTPTYSLYGDAGQSLHTKFVVHGDASIGIGNSNVVLKPSYIYFRQGATQEVTPGLMCQYILQEGSKYTKNKKPAAFSIGGYYRMKDAAIAIVKFEYSNYCIGFSYDVNLSKLKTDPLVKLSRIVCSKSKPNFSCAGCSF